MGTPQITELPVAWVDADPDPQTLLRLYPLEDGETGVFSPDFQYLGQLATALPDPLPGLVFARRSQHDEDRIELTYYAPTELEAA